MERQRQVSSRFVLKFQYSQTLRQYYEQGNFLNFNKICQGINEENVHSGESIWFIKQTSSELEDNNLEVTVEVVHKKKWDRLLFRFARAFLEDRPDSLPLHMCPTMRIPCRKVLFNTLRTEHNNLKLHAIRWGNLSARGCLLCHWEVSYYTMTQQADAVDQKWVIADFIHDEGLAQFRLRTCEKDRKQDGGRVFCNYTLKLFYKHIKKMIVDLDPVETGLSPGMRPCRLHFFTSVPLSIRKTFECGRDSNRVQEGERFLEVKRGRTFFEQPSNKAVFGECPVFSITFQDMTDDDLYHLLSRLYYRSGAEIEFCRLEVVNFLLAQKPTDDHCGAHYINIHSEENMDLLIQLLHLHKGHPATPVRVFMVLYLIEGLLSRGAVVKDQLLLDRHQYKNFLNLICPHFRNRNTRIRCEWVLEEMMDIIDQMADVFSLPALFQKLISRVVKQEEIDNRINIQEGYVRCRKIIITPSRILYVAPEVMMGNRVIRTYGVIGDKDKDSVEKYAILRVSFRDDDGQLMRRVMTGRQVLDRTVRGAMTDGVVVGNQHFNYLGNSNSQMREHGCYFYMGSTSKCESIRRSLGKFRELPTIAKVVARLGLCFTQSKEIEVNLTRSLEITHYDTVCDITGGANRFDEEYTFSDGVGRSSKQFFETLAAACSFPKKHVPSCVQFRFRGGKGVLCLDPILDEYIKFGARLRLVDPQTGLVDKVLRIEDPRAENQPPAFHRVVFRKSQMKFSGPKKKDGTAKMELVKYSAPTSLSLNRPFINILDQVSEMQSARAHERICNRIEALLDRHLRNISMVLVDEHMCRSKIKELPHRLDIDRLPGFQLATEPFFRSLIKALVRYSLHKQLHKAQIHIPHELGRAMFGVVDETGLLQSGQVYCSYTVNIGLKTPAASASKRVLSGPVLVTKNPCIVSGDVRVFEAVDIPQLSHLRDVLVFPQHGPRPHPDEMAGSDLDGDEYSVIWDPELLFEYNMPPMDYSSKSGGGALKPEDITKQMIAYYHNYMSQDQVGQVANAHLIASDTYGLDSVVAKGVAKKHSEAVDFPKTGQAPEKLTADWTLIPVDEPDRVGIEVPPEKAPRMPDFMEKDQAPVYRSARMAGKVYRQVKMVQEVLYQSEQRDQQLSFPMDESLFIDDWEIFKKEAEEDYANYCNTLKREMEHYGILTEAELLTGAIMEMRNRLSDKENDDMSLYNTMHVLESKMTAAWTSYRKGFFENENKYARHPAFGEYREKCHLYENKPYASEDNDLHYFCSTSDITLPMKQKAVAYYRVAYEKAQHVLPEQGRVLSFPWLVWDILREVKQDYILNPANEGVIGRLNQYTMYNQLTAHMSQYCAEHQDQLLMFSYRVQQCRAVALYTHKYDGTGRWRTRDHHQMPEEEEDSPGLLQVLFIASRWADVVKVYEEGNIREMHLMLLMLQYATSHLPGTSHDSTVHLEVIPVDQDFAGDDERLARIGLRSPGRLFALFLQYIGSCTFRRLPHLFFDDMGYDMAFFDEEWHLLHQCARISFYSMVFSSRFEELPLRADEHDKPLPELVQEGTSFTIELPMTVRELDLEDDLRKKCGLQEVKMRRKHSYKNGEAATRVRVSAMGTTKALRKLRRLVQARPIHNAEKMGKSIESAYPQRTLQNIRSERQLDDYDME